MNNVDYNHWSFKNLVSRLDSAYIKGESQQLIDILKDNIAKKIIKSINIEKNINHPEIINQKAALLEQKIHFSMDILHSNKLKKIQENINKENKENLLQFDDIINYPNIEKYKKFFNKSHIQLMKKNINNGEFYEFRKNLKQLIGIDNKSMSFYGLSDKYFDIVLGLYYSFNDRTNFDNKKEMLGYQPTPIKILEHILNNISFGENDIFYDIGSGFGRTGFFSEIYKGIKNKSVEYNSDHCNFGKKIILKKKLTKSIIVNSDAKNLDYIDGSVFYFFNSFVGDLLDNVINKLGEVAKKKKIVICALYTPKMNEIKRLKCIYKKLDKEGSPYGIYIYESCLC